MPRELANKPAKKKTKKTVTSPHLPDRRVRFLNDRCAIATASWDLLREDGSVISHWRQAYFISRFGSEWRIFGSAFVSE